MRNSQKRVITYMYLVPFKIWLMCTFLGILTHLLPIKYICECNINFKIYFSHSLVLFLGFNRSMLFFHFILDQKTDGCWMKAFLCSSRSSSELKKVLNSTFKLPFVFVLFLFYFWKRFLHLHYFLWALGAKERASWCSILIFYILLHFYTLQMEILYTVNNTLYMTIDIEALKL